jgi:hypothetical protein
MTANTNFMMVMPTCFFGQLSACFHATSETLGIPTTDGPEHLSTVLALEHNVEFLLIFTHFDFFWKHLWKEPLFFYAWKTSLAFSLG